MRGDRPHQVVERAQLGRGQLAVVGQGAGQAVALRLVVQAAALGGGDVDHQREPPGRRLQERAGADGAGDRAGQVEVAIADQEPAVVVEQLPGQRQHEVVVAADRDQRPGLAGDGRLAQEVERPGIEQQVEQQPAERGGVAVQLGAGTIVADRLAGQAGELDAGDGEAGVAAPRGRERPGRAAGRVGDGHPHRPPAPARRRGAGRSRAGGRRPRAARRGGPPARPARGRRGRCRGPGR